MSATKMMEILEANPVIAAVHDTGFERALASPAKVVFLLKANLLTLPACIRQAHECGKILFIHLDLAEGLGRDRAGIAYLAGLGADGVISTRTQLLRYAKEQGLIAVQRFFALDSQGLASIDDMLKNPVCDFIEIMPGVIGKAISKFAGQEIPVIAGGLIETKKEVMTALDCGAIAVSTGNTDLWYLE